MKNNLSTKTIASDGAVEWRGPTGEFHREDGPAIIDEIGNEIWCQYGKIHREDGPAVVRCNGDQEWYRNGLRHREDGPAIIHATGYRAWFFNGLYSRNDGPAIENEDGTVRFYFLGSNYLDFEKWAKDVNIIHTEEYILLKLKYG